MDAHELSGRLLGFNLHKHTYRYLKDHFIPHAGNNHRPHVLGHRVLFLYSVLLVIVKVSVLSLPLLLPGSAAQSLSVTPSNIIELTNIARSDFGLEPLTENAKLSVAALNKARNMIEEGYFGHYSPNGVSPWYWISQSGYEYEVAGENLAMRFSTAEGVNSAWLSSAAHRANILSDEFKDIGVAVVTDEFQDQGLVTLVVQMFGTGEMSPTTKQELAKEPEGLAQQQSSVSIQQASDSSSLSGLQLSFPQEASFVKVKSFSIIGSTGVEGELAVLIDGIEVGEKVAAQPGEFHLLAQKPGLEDGQHSVQLILETVSGRVLSSDETTFTLDTKAPIIYQEGFSITRALGRDDAYEVAAEVSADSVRTIATIGSNSGVLEQSQPRFWKGEVGTAQLNPEETVPVEIYAQDLAGNETRERVGELRLGEVSGVFSFISDSAGGNSRVLGGMLSTGNLSSYAGQFYLGFIAFLAAALILKIGIRKHIQHPQTIALSSLVLMLASILFAF